MSYNRIITAFLSFALTLAGTLCAGAEELQLRHLNTENSALSHDFTTSVLRDSTGFIWIGTTNGLNRFDGHTVTPYYKGDLSLPSSSIIDLCLDKERRMWVKTTAGTCRYDFTSDSFISEDTDIFREKDSLFSYRRRYLTETLGFGRGDRDIFIRNVTVGAKGRFWIATNLGIYVHEVSSGTTAHIVHDDSEPFSLSDNRVSSIFTGKDGEIWITTDTGVDYAASSDFKLIRITSADGVPLRQSYINGVSQGEGGDIWISTENAGVFRMVGGKGTIKKFNHHALPSITIGLGFIEGNLWIREQTGMLRIDPYGRAHEYRQTADGKTLAQCRCIYLAPRCGKILLAAKNGLYEYDRRSDSFLSISEFGDTYIENITETSSGDIYLSCYSDGLIRWNPSTGETKSFIHDDTDPHSIPSDRVTSCIESSSGKIWIITFDGGIAREDSDGHFTTLNGTDLGLDFQTMIAHNMFEDASGYFWITTTKGLLRLNPKTGRACRYTTDQGFINNEYGLFSSIILPNDDIIAGSRDGIVMLNAAEMASESEKPRIVPTGFFVGGVRMSPGKEGSPLMENIALTRKITLGPEENSFAVSLSLLGSDYGGNTLEYRLKGWNDDWQRTAGDNSAVFSNIPHGKYVLQIRAINPENGVLTRPDIEIDIRPPFYAGLWAILLYVLSGLAIVGLAVASALKISDRRAQQKRIEEKLESDMETMNEKMLFLSNVVHEIKTPLTLIKSPVSNIRKSHPDDEAMLSDLKIIENSSNYLTSLSNELLEYVRVEQKGYVLEKERLDLCSMLKALLFNYSETFRGKGIRTEISIPETPLWIYADKPAVSKIINNLLINAIKYCKEEISISLAVSDGKAVLSVANDGERIPEDWQEKIFKPFMRTSGVKLNRIDGIGLGLPLARALAGMNSGELQLAPASDRTEFLLTLPAASESAETSPGKTVPGQDDEPKAAQQSDRAGILVAEDNDALREYICSEIGKKYNVFAAADGQEAISLLHENDIALVVSDVAMPKMDGVELCRTIRRDMDISHVMIILTSGRNDLHLKLACMESGANLYLEKPLDTGYLLVCIDNLLDKRGMMQKSLRNKLSMSKEEDFSLSRRDKEFLAKVDKVILDNITDPGLAVEQIGAEVNMSNSSLLRKFKRLLNTTPNSYIRTKRLLMAQKMFDEGEDRISDVCYSCGFNNTSYFAKCFREQFGCTPVEYVRKAGVEKQG